MEKQAVLHFSIRVFFSTEKWSTAPFFQLSFAGEARDRSAMRPRAIQLCTCEKFIKIVSSVPNNVLKGALVPRAVHYGKLRIAPCVCCVKYSFEISLWQTANCPLRVWCEIQMSPGLQWSKAPPSRGMVTMANCELPLACVV